MSPLQRVFDALGLTVTYDASFEVARSVREEVLLGCVWWGGFGGVCLVGCVCTVG